MIERKIQIGDVLRLAEGNAFYGRHEVVRMCPGYATVYETSEVGDPLVEIDGGAYIVKRSDLYELTAEEVAIARAAGTIMYAGLNGATREDLDRAARVLRKRVVVDFDITELNTMSDPTPGYRDESPRIRCKQCRHLFLLGRGMNDDPVFVAITRKHLELCEGDAAVTLMRIEQAYKAGWRPQ